MELDVGIGVFVEMLVQPAIGKPQEKLFQRQDFRVGGSAP